MAFSDRSIYGWPNSYDDLSAVPQRIEHSSSQGSGAGLDKRGRHYIIPVQAKSGTDQIGIAQPSQDIRFAEAKFPGLRCRAVAAQFMDDQVIALFELTLQDDEIKVAEERHYRLVPAEKLNQEAIRNYQD